LLLEADPDRAVVLTYLAEADIFVDQREQQTVGIIVVKSLNSTDSEVMNLSVSPAWQHQGIGRGLLSFAVQNCKVVGVKHLVIRTGYQSPQQRIYEKFGFQVVSVAKNYFIRYYAEPIFEAGQQLKDQVTLNLVIGK